MSQQDGPIDVEVFNLDAKAIGGQTIGVTSIPGTARDFQYTPNQTAASSLSLLPLPQFSVLPPENTRLEYYPAFGYYPLNPFPALIRQSFLNQTPNASAPTSNLLSSLNSVYALPPIVLSSPSPTSTNAPATIPAYISIRTISPGVSAGPPTTCGGKGGRRGRGKRSSRRSHRANRGNKNTAPQDPVPTPGMNGDADAKGSDKEQPNKKKGQNRNMTAKKKLVLICEWCKHVNKYQPGNKTKFWAIILELLKQQTGYNLMHPQQTVTP